MANNAKKGKITRGITKETRTTTRKEFKPDPNKYDGLNHAVIVNVESKLSEKPVKEDSKMICFRGIKFPSLVFHFEGIVKEGVEAPYKADKITPFEPGSKAEADYFEATMTKLKHYIETFKGEEGIDDKEYALLSLSAIDELDETDENYGQKVADIWAKFFDNIVTILKPKAKKPIYENKEVFLKLLFIKNNKGKGSYEVPTFVGKGIIELVKKDKEGKVVRPSKLKIEVGKGESIDEKAPSTALVTPGVPSGGAPAGNLDFMED